MRGGYVSPDLPAYVDVIVLRGTRGEFDCFARNAGGVHVPVTALDPRAVRIPSGVRR